MTKGEGYACLCMLILQSQGLCKGPDFHALITADRHPLPIQTVCDPRSSEERVEAPYSLLTGQMVDCTCMTTRLWPGQGALSVFGSTKPYH